MDKYDKEIQVKQRFVYHAVSCFYETNLAVNDKCIYYTYNAYV